MSPNKPRFNSDDQAPLPLEYLTSASDTSLRNFEALQLNHAANLEKEIKVMELERRKAQVMAEMARLLIENRAALLRHVGDHLDRVRGESAA